MFAELCDSNWANRSHRGWTTLASFTAQALAVGALLMLPLIYTEALPHLRLAGPDVIAPPLAAPAPPTAPHSAEGSSNISSDHRLIEPPAIPATIQHVEETSAPPPVDLGGIGVAHGTGDPRASNPIAGALGNGMNTVLPPPPLAHKPPISHMMEGNLIFRVQPDYPDLARRARIQGLVMLRAVISREGTIENLQVLSGHPMLVQAAVKAVQQWRYRPYVLNGEPVEVETQVTVKFVLSGG